MSELTGQPFGKYLLLDRIAVGGMAEIFLAKYVAAAGVTKTVVIKRILPHFVGNPDFLSMFVNEAKVAVSLSHGNIAQVFDFGEIDGEYFLAMEYVHGLSISRLARRARELGVGIPFPIAVYIASELCSGLHYAHTRVDDQGRALGIVHRDVSPQNVLASFEGQVKIIDFGIAKVRSTGEKATEAGALKGKYLYFSPEQARGKPLDGRSDVFATGIVLYELLTGRRPFEGSTMDVLTRIVHGEFDPPSRFAPGLPPQIEAIVMKAMAVNLEHRYESALSMHDALLHYLHTAEPRFTAAWLGHFTRHLAPNEAEKSGVRLDVPSSFLSELQRWRMPSSTPPPSPAAASSRSGSSFPRPPPPAVQAVAVSSGDPKSLASPASARRVSSHRETVELAAVAEAEAPRGPSRARLFLGVGAAIALGVVAGAVALSLGESAYSLDIVSTPPGAELTLDGQPIGQRTPARLADLPADQTHRIELRLAGYQTWIADVPPQQGSAAALNVELLRAEPDAAVAAAEGGDRQPDGPTVAVADGELVVQGREHAVSIPPTAAARVRLDPSRTYRLTVDGAASLGNGRDLGSAFYFGERSRGAPAARSFGRLMPGEAVELTGIRALYAFVLDDDPSDNAGVLRVLATDLASGKDIGLVVDPTTNALAPDRTWARITGLDPEARYEIAVSAAVTLGAEGGPVTRLLYYAEPGDSLPADGGQGVIAAGAPARIANARSVWLLLPDDDRFDNNGSLAVSATVER